MFAAGVLGALAPGQVSGAQEYMSIETVHLNAAGDSGHLLLGLMDEQATGSGFSDLKFSVTVGGTKVLSEDFSSLAAANAFFANHAVDLGAVPQSSDLAVVVTFDLTTSTANSGYGEDFLLGLAPPNPVRSDYLGEGHDQFLIESTANGMVDLAQSVGGKLAYSSFTTIGAQWSIEGSGDYLGEGHDQILFENTSGQVQIGDVEAGKLHLANVTTIAPQWKFDGSGDYLGLGHDQFLIENAGAIDLGQFTNGKVGFASETTISTAWKFEGTGDYLGLGHDQFLIENTSGALDLGQFASGKIGFTSVGTLDLGMEDRRDRRLPRRRSRPVPGRDPQRRARTRRLPRRPARLHRCRRAHSVWTFVETGDFLGEGRDEFLIQNTSGVVELADFQAGHLHLTQVADLGPAWMFH